MKKIVMLLMVVMSVWAVDTASLLKAQKEAKALYKKTKNVYPSIKILDDAGIKEILKNKPDGLSQKQYADLLEDYALYHIYTDDDGMHGKNLHIAIDSLEKIKSLTPNDAQIYLLQGRAYLKLFRFSVATRLISSYSTYKVFYDESYTTIPPAMKAAYVKYAQLVKEQNIPLQLSQEEKLIVNRQRMFIDYYSSFKKKEPWWNKTPSWENPKPYKKEFENICHEYVTMLNQMPDNNLTECSRYVNGTGSFIIKPVISEDWRTEINYYLVYYKKEEFIDHYDFLQLSNQQKYNGLPNTIKDVCFYRYVDFNLTRQINDISNCSYKLEKHFFKK
jgi:hypothetical protein